MLIKGRLLLMKDITILWSDIPGEYMALVIEMDEYENNLVYNHIILLNI